MMKIAAGLLAVILAGARVLAQQAAPPQRPQAPNPWQPEEPQGHWSQTWHDGFRAGASAANRDAHDEVPLSLAKHQQYRHPDLAPMASEDFRDGFEAAFNRVREHLAQIQNQ